MRSPMSAPYAVLWPRIISAHIEGKFGVTMVTERRLAPAEKLMRRTAPQGISNNLRLIDESMPVDHWLSRMAS